MTIDSSLQTELALKRVIRLCDSETADRSEVVWEATEALKRAYPKGSPRIARVKAMDWAACLCGQQEQGADSASIIARLTMWPANRRMIKSIMGQALQEVLDARTVVRSAFPFPLQPAVAAAVVEMWGNGHRHEAVGEAAVAVERLLRQKVKPRGGSRGDVSTLLQDAFSTSPPQEGQQRLRVAGADEGTETWKSLHAGAIEFGKGCFQRVRNVVLHGHQLPDEELVEAVAAFSLLARWIDAAEVIEG